MPFWHEVIYKVSNQQEFEVSEKRILKTEHNRSGQYGLYKNMRIRKLYNDRDNGNMPYLGSCSWQSYEEVGTTMENTTDHIDRYGSRTQELGKMGMS